MTDFCEHDHLIYDSRQIKYFDNLSDR